MFVILVDIVSVRHVFLNIVVPIAMEGTSAVNALGVIWKVSGIGNKKGGGNLYDSHRPQT